ncbi:MAG: DUF86 domain-containing protein [Candidatus Methanoperedens sp.]
MDNERILEKIDEMENYLRELEEYLPEQEEDYLNNSLLKRACERAFQLASENLLDICNFIISEKGFGMPSDSKDSVRKLAENQVLPASLSTKLEELVGFRNLLVHQYGRVDDSRSYSYLNMELKDFYEFIEIIDRYIENQD